MPVEPGVMEAEMILVKRADSGDKDFIELVAQLDAELDERDGQEHSFYNQFNKIDKIKFAVIAYIDKQPVGCGAIKLFDEDSMEIKRMYVPPIYRGKGIAARILTELESWAREMSFSKCILETGKRQPEAIGLYKKHGYNPVPNYGQYAGINNSLCFEKRL